MRFVLTVFVALAALSAVNVAPGEAQSRGPKPWCISGGSYGPGSMDCTYWTLRQCRESASGAGGVCVENPRYNGPAGDRTGGRYRGGSNGY